RDLEAVRVRDDVVHVEQRRHHAAHPLAVVVSDAAPVGQVVDEQTDHPPDLFMLPLRLDELVPGRFDRRRNQSMDSFCNITTHGLEMKKVGYEAHFQRETSPKMSDSTYHDGKQPASKIKL